MWTGVKSFVAKPVGKWALVAVAIAATSATFLYLGPYVATLSLLIFGLVVPIYAGWKRPRQLAIAGLVILLATGPITAAVYSDWARLPSPSANSPNALPYGASGSILQNAHVAPFTGGPGSDFVFTADFHPEFVPAGDAPPTGVYLYVSTCPGATSNNSPTCGSGFPFFQFNHSLPANASSVTPVRFTVPLPGVQIWWWQMGTPLTNRTTANVTWVLLDSKNGLGGVQGPVTGDYLATFGLVLPVIYGDLAFFPGIVYFLALLVYVFFKSREARRKAMAEGAGVGRPPEAAPPAETPAPGGDSRPAAPGREESTCPNCHAIVYPNETSCWKCGTALRGAASTSKSDSPLPSQDHDGPGGT